MRNLSQVLQWFSHSKDCSQVSRHLITRGSRCCEHQCKQLEGGRAHSQLCGPGCSCDALTPQAHRQLTGSRATSHVPRVVETHLAHPESRSACSTRAQWNNTEQDATGLPKSSVPTCQARHAWPAHLGARRSWWTHGPCQGLPALTADPSHGRGSQADTAQHILQIRKQECLKSHGWCGDRTHRTQDSRELPESEDCSARQEAWHRARAGSVAAELRPAVRRHLPCRHVFIPQTFSKCLWGQRSPQVHSRSPRGPPS